MTKIPARASTSRPRQPSALHTTRAPAQSSNKTNANSSRPTRSDRQTLDKQTLDKQTLDKSFGEGPPYFRIRIVRHDPVPKHNVTIDRSPAMYPAVNNGLNAAYRGQSK